jgi:hypothetical protein
VNLRHFQAWAWAGILVLVAGVAPAAEEVDQEIAALKEQIRALQERVERLEAERAEQQAAEAKKPELVQSGEGRIQFDGLMQNWFSNDSAGRNTFRLRRMELKFSGQLTPQASWTVMVDPAKNLSLGQGPPVFVNQNSNVLQDSFLTYSWSPKVNLSVGQYKVPLSIEGLQPAAQLVTVERALFNSTLPLGRGRVGDIRDTGIMAYGTHRNLDYQVGLFNDSGPRQNATDDNDQKAVLGRLVYRLPQTPGLQLGVYGSTGTSGVGDRDRLGGEVKYTRGPHLLQGEFVRTRDGQPAVRAAGGYLLYGYQWRPEWQGVLRLETWDPNRDQGSDREKDLTLGATYFLKGHRAKVQLNWVTKSVGDAAPSFLGRSRNLLLTNFQVSY